MCPAHSVTLYRGRLDPILEISEEHSLVTLIESETAPLWVWSPPTSVMTNQSVSFHSPFKSLEMAETHLWIEVGSWRPPLAVRPIAGWFPWHVFRQQSSREWPSSTLTSPPPLRRVTDCKHPLAIWWPFHPQLNLLTGKKGGRRVHERLRMSGHRRLS